MNLVWRSVAAVLLAVCMTGTVSAEVVKPDLYHLMRTLNYIQDRVVQGDAQAYRLQRRMLRLITDDLPEVPYPAWNKKLNGRALAAYVLSGGSPEPVWNILRSGVVPNAEPGLIAGALAYASGQSRVAARQLGRVQLDSLPRRLAGQVAIIRAGLQGSDKTDEALALLDKARLLAPGSLIEEAALRRSIRLTARAGKLDRFESLLNYYLRHYGQSVYAKKTQDDLTGYFIGLDYGSDASRIPRLETMLGYMDEVTQLQVCLALSRAAVIAGQRRMALFTARRIQALSEKDSLVWRQAAFFMVAVDVTRSDFDKMDKALSSLDTNGFPEVDKKLAQAARTLFARLYAKPDLPVPDVRPVGPGPVLPDPKSNHSIKALIERADKALETTKLENMDKRT